MTRLEKLEEIGLLDSILWEERYKEPRPGYFAKLRARRHC
jgi:hypothetical protein